VWETRVYDHLSTYQEQPRDLFDRLLIPDFERLEPRLMDKKIDPVRIRAGATFKTKGSNEKVRTRTNPSDV